MQSIGVIQENNLLRQFYDKEIRLHFRHIRPIKDKGHERYLGFDAGGVHFGMGVKWNKFLLSGCYVGFAIAYLEKHNEALVPVALIKDLYDFRQTLIIGSNPLKPHMIILKKAFALIGYDVNVSVRNVFFLDIEIMGKSSGAEGKVDQTKYVRFLKNGVDDDILLARMMHSLYWFV